MVHRLALNAALSCCNPSMMRVFPVDYMKVSPSRSKKEDKCKEMLRQRLCRPVRKEHLRPFLSEKTQHHNLETLFHTATMAAFKRHPELAGLLMFKHPFSLLQMAFQHASFDCKVRFICLSERKGEVEQDRFIRKKSR